MSKPSNPTSRVNVAEYRRMLKAGRSSGGAGLWRDGDIRFLLSEIERQRRVLRFEKDHPQIDTFVR